MGRGAQPAGIFGALNQHRNVLTRAERITHLMSRDLFKPEDKSPLGLVKVANRKVWTLVDPSLDGLPI